MAKDHSLDTDSASKGGDLGRVYAGQLNDQFNSIAFGPNETNDKYVATPYGDNFAVFEITDRKSMALPQGIRAQDQQPAIEA